ncbi:MAG: helix-turn-helix domain-containing protein [Verrucomicrobiia bacterium]
MRDRLDTQLAAFLRKRRGEATYAQFARKLGITPSTLFRLEHQQQSITLGRLEQILGRLKCSLKDVFSEQFSRSE